MTNRISPLPSSFVFLAAFPFRKHKKGGGDDLSAKLDVEGLGLEGDDDALSLGDLGGSLGGSEGGGDDILGGLTSKNEKVDQLEGTVNDLKNQVETIGNTSSSIKGQVESMRKDLEGINDSIKNLLCVYEAVSRQYNPFVDQEAPKAQSFDMVEETPIANFATKSDIPVVDEEGELELATDLDAPLDKVLRFEDNSATAQGLKFEGMELETEVDGEVKVSEPAPAPLVPLPESEPKVELALPEATKMPDKNVKIDSYALRQIYKLVDYQLEKVYTAKSTGEQVPNEEMEMLERWIHELKVVGVK